jgi:cell division protein FtsI (penicillin-binding protein 3)
VVRVEGTGRRAGLRGVRVAGKTGTAQKLEPTGSYGDRFVAWFAGVVPADAPRLAIVVALDEPRRPHHTGGAAAAPLFARVAAAQLARFGIQTAPQIPSPPTPAVRVAAGAPPAAAAKPAAPAAASERERPEFERLGDRVLVPDLTGLTVEEVRKITEQNAVLVETTGSGRVVAQEPSPGSVLARRHQVMRLRLAQAKGEES